MIACLRSAQFLYADGISGIVVELRRHHDTRASANNKEFLVTRRLTRLNIVMTKPFSGYREAARHWDAEVAKLVDEGLERRDVRIVGWHEEG